MGRQRHTDLATTPRPGHREGKGQREGPPQEVRGRHQVTGTHPREQGTAGNTTWGQGMTGGPAILGAGQGAGHTNTEGGGREDGQMRDTTHRRERHRPTPPTPSRHRKTPRGHRDQDRDTGTHDRPPQRHTPTTTSHRSREPTAREPHRVAHTQETTENLPPHPNRQATTRATFHCKGHHIDRRTRAPEGQGTRLKHQRRGLTWRQGPQGTPRPRPGHWDTRQTTSEAHAHHDKPPQPGTDSARTTPGCAHTGDHREPATAP